MWTKSDSVHVSLIDQGKIQQLTYVSSRIASTLINSDKSEYCHEETEGDIGSCV